MLPDIVVSCTTDYPAGVPYLGTVELKSGDPRGELNGPRRSLRLVRPLMQYDVQAPSVGAEVALEAATPSTRTQTTIPSAGPSSLVKTTRASKSPPDVEHCPSLEAKGKGKAEKSARGKSRGPKPSADAPLSDAEKADIVKGVWRCMIANCVAVVPRRREAILAHLGKPHHDLGSGKAICDVLTRSTGKEKNCGLAMGISSLKRHIADQHVRAQPSVCLLCRKSFDRKDARDRHSLDTCFCCPNCGLFFGTRNEKRSAHSGHCKNGWNDCQVSK